MLKKRVLRLIDLIDVHYGPLKQPTSVLDAMVNFWQPAEKVGLVPLCKSAASKLRKAGAANRTQIQTECQQA